MAERLERWTRRRPRVHVPLGPLAGFVLGSPKFKSSATLERIGNGGGRNLEIAQSICSAGRYWYNLYNSG